MVLGYFIFSKVAQLSKNAETGHPGRLRAEENVFMQMKNWKGNTEKEVC